MDEEAGERFIADSFPLFLIGDDLIGDDNVNVNKFRWREFKADSLLDSKEFKDTNDWFEIPDKIDKRITNFMTDEEIKKLALEIKNV